MNGIANRLVLMITALLLLAPRVWSLPVIYQQDDGIAETTWGNGTPNVFQSHILLVHFNSVPGGEWIRSLSVAFPAGSPGPAVGELVELYVWDDPNGDGNPSDASVLASQTVTIERVTSGTDLPGGDFTEYAIYPTEVGPSFFVGYRYEGMGPDGVYSRLLDTSSDTGQSWDADLIGGGSLDPNNLSSATFLLSSSGNLLIRAVGGPEYGLVNGSFETSERSGWGLLAYPTPSGWEQIGIFPSGTSPCTCPVFSAPTDGNFSFVAADDFAQNNFDLFQEVRIPPNATTLSFDYRHRVVVDAPPSPDWVFVVYIAEGGGGALLHEENVLVVPPFTTSEDLAGSSVSIDLSSYRDDLVRIQFTVLGEASLGSEWYFELDNVRINVDPLVAANSAPPRIQLHGAFPNPFNPSTTIGFELSESGPVRLDVYSIAGRRVATLLDGHRPAGRHVREWNGRTSSGRSVASGVYLYRLTAGGETLTKRMTLLK